MNDSTHANCSARNDVNVITDFIVNDLSSKSIDNNSLKLQKLLYYVQAWHLAFYGTRMFNEKFEAWVHGPVCRKVYGRFASTKNLYSPITAEDVLSNDFSTLSDADMFHIKSVLEAYAVYSGTQLEELTHREQPWLAARAGCGPFDSSSAEIDDAIMQSYYASRL